MEFLIALAMKLWQWTLLIAIVIMAWVINKVDKRAKTKLKFSYTELNKQTSHRILNQVRLTVTHGGVLVCNLMDCINDICTELLNKN